MALINCPDCGTEVSDAAAACPKCSRPISARLPAQAAAAPMMNQATNVVVQVGGGQKRWSRGTAILLSFLVPGLGQMYKGQVFNGLLWFVMTIVGYVAMVFPDLILHLLCIIGAGSGDETK